MTDDETREEAVEPRCGCEAQERLERENMALRAEVDGLRATLRDIERTTSDAWTRTVIQIALSPKVPE